MLQINELENSRFLTLYSSFIKKLKKNVLVETHRRGLAGRHPKMLYWTSNGQFISKMDLPIEKVSKITCGALTSRAKRAMQKQGQLRSNLISTIFLKQRLLTFVLG